MDPDSTKSIEDLSEEDEDLRHEEKPSLLKIMVEKHQVIEEYQQSVSLVKKGIEDQETDKTAIPEPVKEEFDGLNKLLVDSKVEKMIKSVAGDDSHDIIYTALGDINASTSIDHKRAALAAGLKKLHTNLNKSEKSGVKSDPIFNFAMSLVKSKRGL